MAAISTWSTTAGSNNSASPDGWPEGMAPSGVNDSARENMSALRTWYEDAEWINWGDTTAYVGATQFKIAGADVTSRYTVGRRVRVVGTSTGTIYGTITVSAFSTDTTVTVVFDSGSMSSETLTASLGAIQHDRSLPAASDTIKGGIQIASQAAQEAGSDATLATTAGRQHFHQSAAKAWVDFTGTGTPTRQAYYNVSSITDNGTGDYTINFTTAFSSANYVAVGSCETTSSGSLNAFTNVDNGGRAAGSCRVLTGSPASGGKVDQTGVMYTFFGDQ